jgi:hypothetical protein
MKKPYLKKICQQDKIAIWLVDGKYIRDNISIAFTQGGHGYVYDYIPKNEIWIDNCNLKEIEPIIQHELYERFLMKYGDKSYSQAHNMANTVEKRGRIDGN